MGYPVTVLYFENGNDRGKPRVVDHHERAVSSTSEALPKHIRPASGRSRDRARRGREPAVPRDRFQHKHLTTTMRYMHVVPGVTAEAIRMLDRPLPKGFAPEGAPEVAPGFCRILVAAP